MNQNSNTKQMESFEDKKHFFDEGKVFSVLFKTALPIIVLMLFNAAYAFTDSIMAANFVTYGVKSDNLNGGTSIGLIQPLMSMAFGFMVMISAGTGLAYAQSISQKKYVEAKQRHNEAMTMIILMGSVIFIIISIISIPYIYTASGNWNGKSWGDNTNKMVMDGYGYMLFIAISFIPLQLSQAYVRVLRSEGKGDIAAIIPILTLPINIFLDWIFMGVLKIGLIGAAIATLIASISGLLMLIAYIGFMGMKDQLNIKLKFPALKLHKEVVIIIFTFAMASLIRRVFDSVSILTISMYIGNLDVGEPPNISNENWTNSWTAMNRSINMGTMLSLGVGQAMAMLISYYTGTDNKEKIKSTMKYGALFVVICSFAIFSFLFGMQGLLLKIFKVGDSVKNFWFTDLNIAFTLTLIFSIPLSLQVLPVMFYAGLKKPKLTLQHSSLFNLIILLSVTCGFVISQITKQPLFLFGSLAIGSIIALASTMTMFKYRYKHLMNN